MPQSWLLSERLDRALEVATALAALSACEPPVLHRDVKPSNVLIDGAGRARLGDFGLARRAPKSEMEGALTGETGTYLYMAPEIMR
jgi:serine/threonine protein kinase